MATKAKVTQKKPAAGKAAPAKAPATPQAKESRPQKAGVQPKPERAPQKGAAPSPKAPSPRASSNGAARANGAARPSPSQAGSRGGAKREGQMNGKHDARDYDELSSHPSSLPPHDGDGSMLDSDIPPARASSGGSPSGRGSLEKLVEQGKSKGFLTYE